MKLILTQEVTGLGSAGDVVDVRTATAATTSSRGASRSSGPGRREDHRVDPQSRDARSVRDTDHAAQVKAKLEGSTFNVQVRAGEGGRLFGAVTAADIASAINERSPATRSTSGPSWSATRSSRSAPTR